MRILPFWLLVGGLAYLAACNQTEEFITDAGAKLEFSVDTLRFDTVFTALGSATRIIKVYNRNDQALRISRVTLEGSTGAFFRMNVDGTPGKTVEDVEVYARDSVYVFVEVTINPDQPVSLSPFVVQDRIVFETNGNVQQVLLEAWGQNANYIPSRFSKGTPSLYTCNMGEWVWDDPKPYVLYGVVFIDSCTLNIPPGTQIYVHGGVAQNAQFGVFNDGILYTLANGRLRVNGTAANPVVFQGDRLEPAFEAERGQWYGIILGRGSRGNEIHHATVKNAAFGVYVDSLAELTTTHSRYFNTTGAGLIGYRSKITADNCLVYNNGTASVSLIQGGDYVFRHCTMANYGASAPGLAMSNFICYKDNLDCGPDKRGDYRLNATFRNCIVFGSRPLGMSLADITNGEQESMFNVQFDRCILRVNNDIPAYFPRLHTDCIFGTNNDKIYLDIPGRDFRLDSLSIAIDQGLPLPGITTDIDGNARDAMPDLGCFERQ